MDNAILDPHLNGHLHRIPETLERRPGVDRWLILAIAYECRMAC
jgi:hypothetical protein